MEHAAPPERELVKVLVLTATRYERGMIRAVDDRLRASVPRLESDGKRVWQLSDNLEDDLRLVLFPCVHSDSRRLAAAVAAFEEATGAPAHEAMQVWDMTPPAGGGDLV